MEKLDRVIAGLKGCIACICSNCEYGGEICTERLMQDALDVINGLRLRCKRLEAERDFAAGLSQNKSGDLISREALTDVIESTDWYHVNSNGDLVHGATSATGLYRFGDIMSALENAPAVEFEPVVHAHWEKRYVRAHARSEYFCTACGRPQLRESKRCPECGAHMDEVVDNE